MKNSKAKWLLTVLLISIVMSITSEGLIPKVNVVIGIIIILLFIFIAVIFDMIGVAITAQEETPFHSMASKKVTGSNNMNEVSKKSENRQFYKKMLWIAGPVMLQQAINLSVNLTDNIMVGKLQEEAISGVALGNQFYFLFQKLHLLILQLFQIHLEYL